MKKIIVWLRKDLRLHDNPALWEAAQQGRVIPIYIWSEEEECEYAKSEAKKWWLYHSLKAFEEKLQSYDVPLILRSGDSFEQLSLICKQTNADAIFYNELYEPSFHRNDCTVVKKLSAHVNEIRSFPSNLLFSPKELLNQKNEPYKIFTAFWKRTMGEFVNQPLPLLEEMYAYDEVIPSLQIKDFKLLSEKNWYGKFHAYWEPGERGGIARWQQFVDEGLSEYVTSRDFPAEDSVSLLSPYLASGDISVRSVWYAAKRLRDEETETYRKSSIDAFLRQLIWREFAYYQLIHFPAIIDTPLRENFNVFPWQGSNEELEKWKRGRTGYPLVDAGMRQLWETGVMHNRVRMVVASFLVKHLLISWAEGSKWFQETLVDFDLANNAMGWQWVAGSGIDSAPYFRIFNPVLQSKKFDSEGAYIYKWVPELSEIPSKYIHEPWKAPEHILLKANVVLDKTYPFPMIDHSFARNRALEAYAQVKNLSD